VVAAGVAGGRLTLCAPSQDEDRRRAVARDWPCGSAVAGR